MFVFVIIDINVNLTRWNINMNLEFINQDKSQWKDYIVRSFKANLSFTFHWKDNDDMILKKPSSLSVRSGELQHCVKALYIFPHNLRKVGEHFCAIDFPGDLVKLQYYPARGRTLTTAFLLMFSYLLQWTTFESNNRNFIHFIICVTFHIEAHARNITNTTATTSVPLLIQAWY